MTEKRQPSNPPELWELSLRDVVGKLRSGKIQPNDLLVALEHRISDVNPIINALPTLCFDRARQHADGLMALEAEDRGRLCGLPVPIKDAYRVSGVRTTFGSKAYSDHVPDYSDAVVETIERNGGIVYAKSNTPEFEAGANTFNEVFGATVNPWNTKLSTGGSSGGAAAAVATGMAWGAVGADFACSVRNPAAMCGVVGLRPSPGLIAQGPNNTPYQSLSVAGPIARSVEDVATLLDAMVGHDPRDPLSFAPTEESYTAACGKPTKAARIAFSPDLGVTPVDPEVADIVRIAVARLSDAGYAVGEAQPDLSDAHEAFGVLRAYQFAAAWGHALHEHRDEMKPEVAWNIEQGMQLHADEVMRAERSRAKMRLGVIDFMAKYDFLMTPTSIMAAYPVNQRYVEECDGHRFENYLQWMAIAYSITLTSCPAISIPCGFTADGRPVGMQIIGRHREEAQLLAFANAIEKLQSVTLARPIDPVETPPESALAGVAARQ